MLMVYFAVGENQFADWSDDERDGLLMKIDNIVSKQPPQHMINLW